MIMTTGLTVRFIDMMQRQRSANRLLVVELQRKIAQPFGCCSGIIILGWAQVASTYIHLEKNPCLADS